MQQLLSCLAFMEGLYYSPIISLMMKLGAFCYAFKATVMNQNDRFFFDNSRETSRGPSKRVICWRRCESETAHNELATFKLLRMIMHHLQTHQVLGNEYRNHKNGLYPAKVHFNKYQSDFQMVIQRTPPTKHNSLTYQNI